MGRKELEAELRALRKASSATKPISKLRITDIAQEIERLKVSREETPASRAVSSKVPSRRMESSVETVKEAQESEFPTRPSKSAKASVKNVVEKKPVSKKATPSTKVSKSQLKKMLDELSDTDVE